MLPSSMCRASKALFLTVFIPISQGAKDRLSADSCTRLERQPLRILDSKDAGDQDVVQGAPKLYDYLGSSEQQE